MPRGMYSVLAPGNDDFCRKRRGIRLPPQGEGAAPARGSAQTNARHLPSNQQTLPPIAQAMGALKSFFGSFFSKKEQKQEDKNL